MSEATIFLVRPETSSILVGGVDRLDFSFTRPFLELCPDDLALQLLGIEGRLRSEWRSSSSLMSYRCLRKARWPGLTDAVWKELCETCYRGIAYEQWDCGEGYEHPRAIATDQWIGEVHVEMSIEPLEGVDPVVLTITGPYDEVRNRWRADPLLLTHARALAWFIPPRLQHALSEPCPFSGAEQRAFLHAPTGRAACMDIDILISALPSEIAALVGAAAAEFPSSQSDPGFPALEWKQEVRFWVRPRG